MPAIRPISWYGGSQLKLHRPWADSCDLTDGLEVVKEIRVRQLHAPGHRRGAGGVLQEGQRLWSDIGGLPCLAGGCRGLRGGRVSGNAGHVGAIDGHTGYLRQPGLSTGEIG